MARKRNTPTPEAASPDYPVQKIPRKSKMALAIVGLGGLLTFALGILIGAYAFVNYRFERTPQGPEQAAIVTIERGSGVSTIAAQLEAAGVIDSAFIFKLNSRLRGTDGAFKAGEFMIAQPASMADVTQALTEGSPLTYPVTIPEGRTSAQIVRILMDADHLTGEITDIPAEGTLLPETYNFPRGTSRQDVINAMAKAQSDYLDAAWEQRDPSIPVKTKAEALILASIVEKETGVASERPEVASVFTNRLRKGMRLESDPTIIYGITKGEPLGRRIYRSEIDRKTDWNTYQMDGLPKTPICNPGKDAIAAVLNPPETDYLFFVADGSGGHAFARTYAEHRRNVSEWYKIRDVVNPK